MLEYLKFSIGGYCFLYRKVNIEVKDGKVIACSGTQALDEEPSITTRFTKKKSDKFLDRLDKQKINGWKAHYEPELCSIMDGTHWDLEYKVMSKRCRHISGDNAYPENWNAFIRLLDEYLPDACLIDGDQIDYFNVKFHYEGVIETPYARKISHKFEMNEELEVNSYEQTVSYMKESDADKKSKQECYFPSYDEEIFAMLNKYVEMLDAIQDIELNNDVPFICIEYKKHSSDKRTATIPYCRWTIPATWDDFLQEIKRALKNEIIPGELFNQNWYAYGKKIDEAIYLSVEFQVGARTYYYKTEDDTLKPGDMVWVPVGNDEEKKKAKIKKVEYYLRDNTPFPEDKTRAVICRATEEDIIMQDDYKTDVSDNDWINDFQIPSTEDNYSDEFYDDNDEYVELSVRKGVDLIIVKDQEENPKEYIFTIETESLEEVECNQKEFEALCDLFSISKDNYIVDLKHFFEYESVYLFINGYQIVRELEGYYYVYGYDAQQKSADALFRYKDAKFERYYPREGLWREAPEERLILKERKARYTHLKETEAMALMLLV
ncbi:MAG: hypothetical protein ACK5ML_10315 [Lachnospiraceae bacterium]